MADCSGTLALAERRSDTAGTSQRRTSKRAIKPELRCQAGWLRGTDSAGLREASATGKVYRQRYETRGDYDRDYRPIDKEVKMGKRRKQKLKTIYYRGTGAITVYSNEAA